MDDRGDIRMLKKAMGRFRHQVVEMLYFVEQRKLPRKAGEQIVRESWKELDEMISKAFRRRA